MSITIASLKIKYEQDTVLARQRAKHIAELLGFDSRDQTAIATSVSEIVRNAYNYAADSSVEFIIDEKSIPQMLYININDKGPGIEEVDKILESKYHSKTGLGIGIIGSRKLMDYFDIKTLPGHGTTVILGKKLPGEKPRITMSHISSITDELIKQKAKTPVEEIKEQNQELLKTLDEVRRKQEELLRLNQELEETNRGVVALYAELDERAEHLKVMHDVKTRFFSNMSHEFKTPLNSIAALTRLLIEHTDGTLNEEQTKQVRFIQKSTSDLYEIVNDLLDLAKLESGKISVNPESFNIKDLFASLRGIMRPLLSNTSVNLIFEEIESLPNMYSDETKIAQILRNFISNALKFTERGEVRIKASLTEDGENIIFTVSDTGIGIDKENIDFIFEEFSQVNNNIQKKVRGTGLGLPLSKKLADTLGGSIRVESKVGEGSTFYASIPLVYSPDTGIRIDTILPEPRIGKNIDTGKIKFQNVPQNNMDSEKPDLIVLEISAAPEETWNYIEQLKASDQSKNIPVLIVTIPRFESIEEKYSEIANLIQQIRETRPDSEKTRILIIDDEEIPRYVLKEMLPSEHFEIIEAYNAEDGINKAIKVLPDLIFLDISMPDQNGFHVIKVLNENDILKKIPVIVNTSRHLSAQDMSKLSDSASYVEKKNISQEEILREIKIALTKIIKRV